MNEYIIFMKMTYFMNIFHFWLSGYRYLYGYLGNGEE